MRARILKRGTGIYLDASLQKRWVVSDGIDAVVVEDQAGSLTVLSPSHPALSDKQLIAEAELDGFSK